MRFEKKKNAKSRGGCALFSGVDSKVPYQDRRALLQRWHRNISATHGDRTSEGHLLFGLFIDLPTNAVLEREKKLGDPPSGEQW